jgi:hypothetical protein
VEAASWTFLSRRTSYTVNVPSPHCLTRDFIPTIVNSFAQQSLVDEVLAKEDYTALARAVENVPSFDQSDIHGDVATSESEAHWAP